MREFLARCRHFEFDTLVPRQAVALAAAVLFCFSLALYAGSLRNGFVWDDEGVFVKNRKVREFASIPSFFVNPLVLGEDEDAAAVSSDAIRYYRPLTSTLHVFEYRWFGTDPFGYKLVNLVFNGVVVVCAFLLIRALTGELTVAFLAALLYAANPARGEVVYWAYSDSHIFAALFALLTLLAYHRGRFGLAIGGMALGLLFQEGAILIPGLLLVYQLAFPAQTGTGWRRLAPFFLLAAGYFVLRQWVAGALPVSTLDVVSRVRAAAYLIVKYVQIYFVTDAPVTMYRYAPGMFAPGGVTTTWVILCALLIVLAGAWLWWRSRSWGFWYAWFFAWLLISLNVGGYANYLMGEKSLYLAAIGPSVLLAKGACRPGCCRRVFLGMFLALVVYHSVATVARGRHWLDTTTYIEKLLEFEPDYDVARYQLGGIYLQGRQFDKAVAQFEYVLQLRPDLRRHLVPLLAESYSAWGQSQAESGRLDEARAALDKARQLAPDRSATYNSLGIVYFMRGDYARANAHWQTAVELDPGNIEARRNLEQYGARAGSE